MAGMNVGLMGLGRGGYRVAEALLVSSWCNLTAAASPNAKRLEQFAEAHPGIAVYDDLRSMIVGNALDALFVAVPPHLRKRYLPLAAERGIPVWMLTPAGRQFDEALAWLGEFERAGCPIVVSRSWGIEPALQREPLGLDQVDRFFLAHGSVMICGEEDLDWRGDSERAGGGVLLYRAYPMIDTLVQAMGMPSLVYARMAGVSRPGTRFPYDTEDTAALVCHFTGGGTAVISACWTAGPTRDHLDLFGLAGSVHIDRRGVVVRDRAGQVELQRHDRPENLLRPQIEDFLSELASSPQRLRSTLRQHLSTLALIQAAYLSARTGQPESPAQILSMHKLSE